MESHWRIWNRGEVIYLLKRSLGPVLRTDCRSTRVAKGPLRRLLA